MEGEKNDLPPADPNTRKDETENQSPSKQAITTGHKDVKPVESRSSRSENISSDHEHSTYFLSTDSSVHSEYVTKASTRPLGPRTRTFGRGRPPIRAKKVNKHLRRVEKRKPLPKRKAAAQRRSRRMEPLRKVTRAERVYSHETVESRPSEHSGKEFTCRYCGQRNVRK